LQSESGHKVGRLNLRTFEGSETICKMLEQDSGSSDAVTKVVLKAVASENPIMMYLPGTDGVIQLGDQRYFCM
jgi:hypothetical protein